MTVLEDRLGEYLHVRRQLRFKLKLDGDLLKDFVAFLQAAGAQRITTELSVTWTRRPGASGRYRMARPSMVRGFAQYLATIDTANEIPRRSTARPPGADRALPLWRAGDQRAERGRRHAHAQTPWRDVSHRDRHDGHERATPWGDARP
jgi:hypothetical protein